MELDIVSLIPDKHASATLSVVLVIVAVRTIFGPVVTYAQKFDARDGREDWPWLAYVAKGFEFFDGLLDVLPVKALQARSKKK